jgi:alkylation response protein AidB-like acyl-CoA dehydrogenase
MDVRYSHEQQALRDSAAQIVDRLGPKSVRDLDDTERIAKLDAAAAASGWRELRAAGDDEAPLATAVEVAIVAEELGRGLADVAFLGPTLAAELRRLSGASPAASLETVALVADLSALACQVDGSLPPAAVAIDARNSTAALIVMPTSAGFSVAGVALDDPRAGVDLTRPAAPVNQAGAAVPLPGAAGAIAAENLLRWTAFGLAITCADLVGVMRGTIRLACDYATSRRQYGVAIGSFQAVQHLLADAFVAMEGSRSVALHSAWAVDALPGDEALAAAAVAKAYCARAARAACEISIQVHGGIGNTWDCLAHVYLRRALLSSDVLGGVGPSLERVLEHNRIGGGDGLR